MIWCTTCSTRNSLRSGSCSRSSPFTLLSTTEPSMRFIDLGAIAVLMSVAAAAGGEGTSGKLAQATCRVHVHGPNGADVATKVGAVLPAGTRVRTGADGKAEITFD